SPTAATSRAASCATTARSWSPGAGSRPRAQRSRSYTDSAVRRGLFSAVAANGKLPPRVQVAGVRVGGLDVRGATHRVDDAFAKPLTLVVDGRTFNLRPQRLATPYVDGAVRRAAAGAPGEN